MISLATLFPIYWLFVISVKQPFDLFSTPDVILRSFFWKNYQDVLTNPTLRGYMLNSMIISSGNALLVTTLGFLACYALTRFDLAGKEASSSGRSPTAWRRRRSSCCRFSCY